MLPLLLFLSHKPMAGHRPANAVLLPWTGGWGPWLGQAFSSLVCSPKPNLVPAPPSGDCQEALSSPLCYLPYGLEDFAKPLIPLRHHWVHDPWFAPGVKPSHLLFGTADHFSWSPASVPALVLIQFSYSALLGLSEVTSVFSGLPTPRSKRTYGRVRIQVRKMQSYK